MLFCEDAKVLDAMQLRDIISENKGNATVDCLVFLEAKTEIGKPSKIFPCYMTAWKAEDSKPDRRDGRKPLMFQCTLIEIRDGEFDLVKIIVHEDEFGIRKKIWDKPPAEKLRKDLPLVDGILQ